MLIDKTTGYVRLKDKAVCRGCWLGLLLVVLAAWGAAGATPKRVLLLHSYGRGFEPFTTLADTFRTEVAQQLGEPVEFYDVSLESARFPGAASEAPLIAYLTTLLGERRPDLLVPTGGAAVRFAQEHRRELFPSAPMLIAGTDQRHLQTVALTTNDAVVAGANDLPGAMENILRVLPQTTNVVVVIGNSPLEKFWLGESRREFQRFTNQVNLTWFNELSFAEMRRRVATLPPRSAIFFTLLSVDAEGVPHAREQALRQLHAAANAPIFGLFDTQMGQGIVGGRLVGIEELGRNAAKVAVRILQGEPAGSIRTPVQVPGRPVYDWRELKRWGISETRLPPGRLVRFRQPTLWEMHKWRIIAVTALCLVEAIIIGLLAVNLVKRRRVERLLRESEERLSLTMAAADLGVWILDLSSNRAWASANWCRLFGFPLDAEVSYEKVMQRLHPDDRPAVERAVQRAIEGQADYVAEYRIVRPDGTQRWVSARGRLDSAGGRKGARLLGISVDITERKRAEAEAQRQREELAHVSRVSVMGELAASVAHELNQPLGAILANAEAAELFLQRDPPALDEVRDILADIRKDDERAGEVIRRMRSLLRKGEQERLPVRINSLVEDVFRLVAANAALGAINLQAELTPELPLVQGDRIQLQQVLLNLMMNAMEAVAQQPSGQRRLRVRAGHTGNGAVEISLADSGPGIEGANLPRLFEPFFTTKPTGIGMGLAIARKIVEAHGGRIWAENNAAGGATFRVHLPGVSKEVGEVKGSTQ